MGIRQEFKSRRKLSSEESHRRMLAARGLTPEWWNEQLALQENKCAECKQPMPKPILDVEGKRILCRLCSGVKNQRAKRARAKQLRELAAKKAAGPQTIHEWWRKNRNGLSEAEKIAHEYRDGEVINFMCSINAWMAEGDIQPDDDEGLECLPESIREFCEEIRQHGTVDTDYIITPDEEKKPQGAADGYHRFGYLAAIPADVASRFIEFSERALNIDAYPYGAYGSYGYREKRIARILATLDGRTFIDPDLIVRCATSGCRETNVRAIGEVPPPQWFCSTCETSRQRAAQIVLSAFRNAQLEELRNGNQPRRQAWTPLTRADDRNTVFDDTGRYSG